MYIQNAQNTHCPDIRETWNRVITHLSVFVVVFIQQTTTLLPYNFSLFFIFCTACCYNPDTLTHTHTHYSGSYPVLSFHMGILVKWIHYLCNGYTIPEIEKQFPSTSSDMEIIPIKALLRINNIGIMQRHKHIWNYGKRIDWIGVQLRYCIEWSIILTIRVLQMKNQYLVTSMRRNWMKNTIWELKIDLFYYDFHCWPLWPVHQWTEFHSTFGSLSYFPFHISDLIAMTHMHKNPSRMTANP